MLNALARRHCSELKAATAVLPRTLHSNQNDSAVTSFVHAGVAIVLGLSDLHEAGQESFRWLAQSEQVAPNNQQPHTYIYRPGRAKSPRRNRHDETAAR